MECMIQLHPPQPTSEDTGVGHGVRFGSGMEEQRLSDRVQARVVRRLERNQSLMGLYFQRAPAIQLAAKEAISIVPRSSKALRSPKVTKGGQATRKPSSERIEERQLKDSRTYREPSLNPI